MYSICLICSILLCMVQSALCGVPKSNYDEMSVLARESAQSISKFLALQSVDSCSVHLSDHPAQVLLQSALVALPTLHLYTGTTRSTSLKIEIADFAVRYFRYSESQDSLIREIQISTIGILQLPNIPMIPLPEFSDRRRDTIARSAIVFVENPGYSYAKAAIPAPEKSIFNEIAEPVVLIAVAAISVFLLFSIRSQ